MLSHKAISALAEYFTGPRVADASIRLQLPRGAGKNDARQFFAARSALQIEGYATSEEAQRIIKVALYGEEK